MPYFVYPGHPLSESTSAACPKRLGFLPLSLHLDRDRRSGSMPCRWGKALTARAIAGDLKARYPGLRLFVSTTTMTGQDVARRSFQMATASSISHRPAVHREPRALGAAAATVSS